MIFMLLRQKFMDWNRIRTLWKRRARRNRLHIACSSNLVNKWPGMRKMTKKMDRNNRRVASKWRWRKWLIKCHQWCWNRASIGLSMMPNNKNCFVNRNPNWRYFFRNNMINFCNYFFSSRNLAKCLNGVSIGLNILDLASRKQKMRQWWMAKLMRKNKCKIGKQSIQILMWYSI